MLPPQLNALRTSVLPAAVHVSSVYTPFLPEATSRKNAVVLRRDVLAFAFLRVEYLSLFAHIVSFSHVASETRCSSYSEHDNSRGDNFAHFNLL